MFITKRNDAKMNKNTKTKLSNFVSRVPKALTAILLIAVLSLASIGRVAQVRADQFDEQIRQLNADNSNKQAAVAQLGSQASSFQDAINKLQQQITAMQNDIAANQKRVGELQQQIADAEAELAKQKSLLGQDIRAMYVEDDISTLEMLASSKDLSDFVDKQQYRNSVQDKITTTLNKITDLKHQLSGEKETLDQTIKDQQNIEAQLAAQQGQQNQLLSLNQQQQSDLTGQMQLNNAKVSQLRKQQAAINAQIFGGSVPVGIPGGGGYPGAWAFAPQDSIVDTWGMYNRECVSYTAWKVWSTGRYMPYGFGNANQWDDNARARGFPVDTNPREGDVAIKNAGFYGHAMYVEHVYGDGTIYISQYNAGLDGYYSEARISTSGLVFIHF